MDDLNCQGEVVHQTLRELDVINTWLGGNAITLSGLAEVVENTDPQRTLAIADIGCGGGDLLIRMAEWARSQGRSVQLVGVDANPHIVAYARRRTKNYPEIRIDEANIFLPEFQQQTFDVITATLVLHHFRESELIDLLRVFQNQVRVGVVVNDLHRHPLAYYAIRLLTRLFSRSPMVQFDAPLSVARSFTRADWQRILKAANITNYQLRWRWAFRWQLLLNKAVTS
jgi:2-polyprenyl-3-methyl-5-hydroxy-6-metoxy-1,4-benzoquinol methylase